MYKIAPILPVINISETICFYRDKLQFNIHEYANYLVAYTTYIEIHFYKTHNKYLCENASCYIMVNDIEDLYLSFASKDIIYPAGQLEKNALGVKEFSIFDNNGNLLRFAQND